ncbi:hypothetical protein BDN70DRAFT_930579 [Pholiota conissans]|uniref:Uncharacterized protein n=1 Tax=Pholiota conissans TaxID=109636 RepID=A0A9P5Z7V1_9AGAR|nr:hypothetical protein BDN70DRAFT_930579 [Pholiota conissans]
MSVAGIFPAGCWAWVRRQPDPCPERKGTALAGPLRDNLHWRPPGILRAAVCVCVGQVFSAKRSYIGIRPVFSAKRSRVGAAWYFPRSGLALERTQYFPRSGVALPSFSQEPTLAPNPRAFSCIGARLVFSAQRSASASARYFPRSGLRWCPPGIFREAVCIGAAWYFPRSGLALAYAQYFLRNNLELERTQYKAVPCSRLIGAHPAFSAKRSYIGAHPVFPRSGLRWRRLVFSTERSCVGVHPVFTAKRSCVGLLPPGISCKAVLHWRTPCVFRAAVP